MIEYSKELEKAEGLIKKEINKDKFLYFLPAFDGKYEFCSNDPTIDKWCQNVKRNKVKKPEIKFVVNAARESLTSSQQTQSPAKSNSGKTALKTIDPNSLEGWDTNIAETFNLYCQKSGMKYPEFKTIGVQQKNGGQSVSIQMITTDGKKFITDGSNKQQARNAAIKQYAKEVLGVKFEEESSTSAPAEKETSQELVENVAARLLWDFEDYKSALNCIPGLDYQTKPVRTNSGQAIQCNLLQGGKILSTNLGSSKKDAQQMAAKKFIVNTLKIDVDNLGQFNAADEFKVWDALNALSGKQKTRIDEIYKQNGNLPDVIVTFLAAEKKKAEQAKQKENLARLARQRQIENNRKILLARLAVTDKESNIVSVEPQKSENGRRYTMHSSDGTTYQLSVNYGEETKNKRVLEPYAKHERPGFYEHLHRKAIDVKSTPMKAVRVTCEKITNGKIESFSVAASSPNLEISNDSLNLMLLSNLDMTIKRTDDNSGKDADKTLKIRNAFLIRKLLAAANDPIIHTPEAAKKNIVTNRLSAQNNVGR